MAKKSLKIITLLALMAIPQPISINESYSPKLRKLEDIEKEEVAKKEIAKKRYDLIEINETIESIERKRDFILMRLNEKNTIDSMKNEYNKRLNKINEELKEYYSRRIQYKN
ncbi:MAG TPA: hypothetical protein PK032_02805 [Candidatus Pacearchaeota archaeon]|nr:hypothetical protein [Candidatus Pacearchaeota archaeon]